MAATSALAQETGTQSFAALLDANTAAPDRQLNQRCYRKTLPAYGQARLPLPPNRWPMPIGTAVPPTRTRRQQAEAQPRLKPRATATMP
jgi:hypothetical protein